MNCVLNIEEIYRKQILIVDKMSHVDKIDRVQINVRHKSNNKCCIGE
jgi:hypothetical protein